MFVIYIIFFNVISLLFILNSLDFFLLLIDVHVISFNFLGLIICTYLSWSNYYLAQKCDPGFIVSHRDQQYRV